MSLVADKKTLYVGGLHESVTEDLLRATFIPFGDLTHVQIPLDAKTRKHRGFGFISFEERLDAAAAIDNMHLSELYGRVLKVSVAKPQALKSMHKAIWETDEFTTYLVDTSAAAAGNKTTDDQTNEPDSTAATSENQQT